MTKPERTCETCKWVEDWHERTRHIDGEPSPRSFLVTTGYCCRFPKSVHVSSDHHCGEWEAKP